MASRSRPAKTAVGREPLAHDQQVAETFRPLIVTADQKTADVGEPVLLAAHGGAVGQREHLLGDFEQRAALIPLLPLADKVGVLGETTGVDDEGDPVLRKHSLDRAEVGHRHRLAAAGVVGHGHHGERDLVPTRAPRCSSEPSTSMLPLNGDRASVSYASGQGRLSAMPPQYSMLARVVSKWLLLGMMSPGLMDALGENPFRRTALVGRAGCARSP